MHAFEEHVGELVLRVDAPSLAALFEDAAHALAELTAGEVTGQRTLERVKLEASDRDALLVDWLNEIIYCSESRKKVYPEVHVERVTDREIEATLYGVEPQTIHTPVKAATMHGVHVTETSRGYTARVVLDV